MNAMNGLPRLALCTIGLTLLVMADAHPAQQMPPPKPKPAPRPVAKPMPPKSVEAGAILLLTADDACELFVDGEKIGDLKRDEVRKVPVSLGQHLIRAVSGGAEWRHIVEIKEKRQYVLTTDLKGSAAVREVARSIFREGLKAMRSNEDDIAIAKFTEAAAGIPNCFGCYINIASIHERKKAYSQAEIALKKAIELQPDAVAGYVSVAELYNQLQRSSEAAAASEKALKLVRTGTAAFNDTAEWRASAHYEFGRALVGLGKRSEALAEFEACVKEAPQGPHAPQARSYVEQLKK